MENIIRHTLPTMVLKNVASGAGDPFGAALDMSGWNGVHMIALDSSGASTAGNTLGVYGATSSTATSTSDGWTLQKSTATITSPASTAGAGKGLLRIDIPLPTKRYVTGRLTRTTATAHGGILAIQYGSPRMESSTKGSTDDLTTALIIYPQTTGSTST